MAQQENNKIAFDKYRKDFSKHLIQIRSRQEFCDIDIQVEQTTFRAHRVVLAAGSTYFHAMFCSGMVENYANVITLHDMDPQIFAVLLDFIYLGEITITEENCQDLLYAADMIGLLPVVSMCVNFLKDNIQPYNCIGIFACANTPNLQDLQRFSEDYILSNFTKVTKEEEFMELPHTDVMTWLRSEMINIAEEVEVLEVALCWTEFNVRDRLDDLKDLLECVRFPLINHTQMQDLFSQHVKNRCVVQSVRTYLRTCDILSDDIRSFPRKSSTRSIYVIGGFYRPANGRWSDAISVNNVHKFDLYNNTWENVPSLSYPRNKHGAVSLNRKIYVVGGEDDSLMLNSLEIFDPQAEYWSEGAPLNYARCGFGLCTCDGKIYALGGWIGAYLGDTIEMYDPSLDSWVIWATIPRPRFSCGVTEMEGMIYMVGGTDISSGSEMSSADSFNPVTKEWTELPEMNITRSDMALVSLDGYLYAIGGFSFNEKELNSVERYSPEDNEWTLVSPMFEARSAPSAVGLNGRLYVIGGSQRLIDNPYAAPITLQSVECYDPLSDTWTELPPLPKGRSETAAIVL